MRFGILTLQMNDERKCNEDLLKEAKSFKKKATHRSVRHTLIEPVSLKILFRS